MHNFLNDLKKNKFNISFTKQSHVPSTTIIRKFLKNIYPQTFFKVKEYFLFFCFSFTFQTKHTIFIAINFIKITTNAF